MATTNRQRLVRNFAQRQRRKLPPGSSAQPVEDSPLFNPLIHGNRNAGRFGTRSAPPQPFHDGAYHAAGRGPFKRKTRAAQQGRARTRPTPGSSANRNTARWN